MSDIARTIYKNGAPVLLARVLGNSATAITQASISTAALTVYLLDDADPDSRTAITGHTATALTVANCVFDTMQKDDFWKDELGNYVDATGYNFRHQVNVSAAQAFATAGRRYLAIVSLTPTSGQVIQIRFKLYAE